MRIKLFLSFLLVVLAFYAYYLLPYCNRNIKWKDIAVADLKVNNQESEYEISGGYLYKNGKKRKLGIELNPFTLIENEKVLRLALFYQINKEDPLFTGPGLKKSRIF